MANQVVMDEVHVTVTAPAGRPARFYHRVRRALTAGGFLARVRRAARLAAAADPALAGVRVTVSR